ncbi:MAG: hypothetical protein JST01_11150 [Cyanobacteria bacterium SZAS TMP-1]|nr:hypothetical protein [Cyanobacteria bacterium SZAS TMP-1]
MRNKTSTRVVLLSDSLQAEKKTRGRAGKKSAPLLPEINFSSDSNCSGLLQLADGRYRHVYELDGVDIAFSPEYIEKLHRDFLRLLNQLECDIQFVVTNRIFPLGGGEKFHEAVGLAENDYLKWYADYQFKWFTRVSQCTYLPQRRHFMVVTTRAKEGKALANCLANLNKLGQKYRALNRQEIRTLIMQDFVLPHETSERAQVQKFAECKSASTLMDPIFEEADDHLRIADLLHGGCHISYLPAEVQFGWLLSSLTVTSPSTVSLHIRQSKPVGAKKGQKAVNISLYFSSFGKTPGELKGNLDALKEHFERGGARFNTGRGMQARKFRSSLPLGMDELQLSHRVTTEVAATCWPCISAIPPQKLGVPIGYAVSTREPFMLAPNESTSFLVVNANGRTNEAITSLAALHHLAVGVNVLFIGSGQTSKFLTRLLGPQLSHSAPPDCRLTGAEVSRRPYTLIDCTSRKKRSGATLPALKETVDKWFSDEKQMLVVDDASIFLDCPEGAKYLKQIVAAAKKRNKRVILALSPRQLESAPTLWKDFANQMIFQPSRTDASHIKQYLRITEPLKFYFEDSLLLKCGNRRSILRPLWSPMDAGILLNNHADLKASKQALAKKRDQLYLDVKEKNPNIPETDAWRQTVYYLGLQLSG